MKIGPAMESAARATSDTTDTAANMTKSQNASDKNAAYNQNLENGMSTLQQGDPALFAKIMTAGQSGNGNNLVEDELQAYKEGYLTKDQAIAAVSGAQSLANKNGGGKINKKVRMEAQDTLGGKYIKGGQTRAGHAILKFLESTSPLAQVIKGIKNKTSDGPGKENVLEAGSSSLQSGIQTALSDLANTDPDLARKFSQDADRKDGNAMAEDLVTIGQEAEATDGPFTDSDAAMLGSQIGQIGKGKVSKQDSKAFEAQFGTGTIDRGSTRASKSWNKIENGMSNFMSSLVSPITNGVGMIDQFAKGNVNSGLKDLSGMAKGVAQDAALIVAPEAAPEIAGTEATARGGEIAGSMAKESTSITQAINDELKGIYKTASNISDNFDSANNIDSMTQDNQNTHRS